MSARNRWVAIIVGILATCVIFYAVVFIASIADPVIIE